jgi:sn-glycerol 3-phosphate transport system permease protein
VGLENYQRLFTSADYGHSVLVSLEFSIAVVVIGLSIALFLAMLVNQKIHGGRFYRTLLIWPYALSPAVAGIIWLFLLSPTVGLVNYGLDTLFGIKPDWTGPNLALLMVTATAIWKNLGYNIIFYLAALQSVPGVLLEAAEIDGAGSFQKFWRITFPLLSPTTFFLFTMNMIYSFFSVFGLIDVMTRGGPIGATNILIYNLYQDGFVFFKTGLASAQSIILFVLVIILVLVQFRKGERSVHYGA